MCPSGFLGRRFTQLERALQLNNDPRTWSRDDALRALTDAGDELSGNLIIGERSLERWKATREREDTWAREMLSFTQRGYGGELPAGVTRAADGRLIFGRRPWDPPEDIDAWLSDTSGAGSSSSLGGERPKLVTRRANGNVLMKFSPPVAPPDTAAWHRRRAELAAGLAFPVGTPQAQRWADLLRVEAHCAQTLRASGVEAVEATAAYSLTGRVVLEVVRFDRLSSWGRRGAASLYWYSMERLGDVRTPAPEVVAALVHDGHLPESARGLVERVHSFSAAIGNNDAHLGNYGLCFDEAGRASLAPFYDILPMILAPSHDELPDARLRPRPAPPLDPVVETWVTELVRRVGADDEISPAFLELWLRLIGR